jgi:prenyltransferase beta subunit
VNVRIVPAPAGRAERFLSAALAACAAICLCTAHPALAQNANPASEGQLESTARYLESVQNADGGFADAPGGQSDPEFSAWVALALAAAGVNPRDQYTGAGTDAYTYLTAHPGEMEVTTDFERLLLVVDATGTSPEDFGGVRLVHEILSRQLTAGQESGGFVHQATGRAAGINDTIFAILALSPVREPAVQSAIKRAAHWLIDEQDGDGGWPTTCPKTVSGCSESSEVDMTAAAVQALTAAGMKGSESQRKALTFLHDVQDSDGGFPEFPGAGEGSNVASSAWAVQAIWAAGENPETWIQGPGREPLDYMASLQQPDGSVAFTATSDSNPVWMTAYAAPAFAGEYWPIPAPAYVERTTPPAPVAGGSTSSSPGSQESGQGGETSRTGGGVIAGGGGAGAPLFSRPQSQSRGRTPGGVRSLSRAREKQSVKPRRDPGPRRKPAAVVAAKRAVKPVARHHERPARSSSAGRGSEGAPAGEPEVRGSLIRVTTSAANRHQLEPSAPGLRGAAAGAGGNETSWLSLGIGGALAVVTLAGSQLERRRPQVIR